MAINCYTGLQGSGKSYETVASVIVPALKSGRRIVTNISGLDEEAIREFLEEQRVRSEDIREIVHFAFEDILKPGFFCRTDEKTHEHTKGTHVNAGDLVIVDEVWRFWGSGEKLKPEHLEFFRMHRHYTDTAGVSCDLAIITQDVGDLERKLKAVIETTFQMVKLKNLGRPKNYRIEIYTRANVRRKAQQVLIRKYDPKIFALYSSYDGKGGKEQVIDGRQNILKGSFFKLVLPAIVILGVFCTWAVANVFQPKQQRADATKTSTHQNKSLTSDPSKPENARNEEDAKNSSGSAPAMELRIVGVFEQQNGKRSFLLESREGTRVKSIYLTAANWSQSEVGYEVVYKGNRITESEYQGRSSNLVGHASAPEVDFKVPLSPN